MKELPLLFLLPILFLGCAKEEKSGTFSTNSISLVAEAPLFEGANTLSATIPVDLGNWLAEHQIAMSDISRIELSKARVSPAEGGALGNVNQLTLSLVADAVSMQEVAVLNPLAPEAQEAVLQVAGDQKDILSYFNQPSITFILDANLLADQDSSLNWTGDFEFTLFY